MLWIGQACVENSDSGLQHLLIWQDRPKQTLHTRIGRRTIESQHRAAVLNKKGVPCLLSMSGVMAIDRK